MIEYVLKEDDPEFEFPFVLRKSTTGDDSLEIAEMCAEDYHKYHDGWESQWPITILVRMDGVVEEFSVEREYTPDFWARRM